MSRYYYAQITTGICTSELDTHAEISDPNMISRDSLTPSMIGWTWDGVKFVAPTPAVLPRWITVGAFFDRFGSAKYSILASTNSGVQALITDSSVRKYIDLDNPVLFAGLQALQAAGFDIDASAIINGAIQAGERP